MNRLIDKQNNTDQWPWPIKLIPFRHIPESLDALSLLWQQQIGHEGTTLADIKTWLHEDLLPEDERQLPHNMVLYNIEQNEVIGFGSIREKHDVNPLFTPWLSSLFIAPTYQGNGLGTQLVHELLTWCNNQSFSSCYAVALNQEIAHWYIKQSWELIAIDFFQHYHVFIMEYRFN
jgi:GNAT superfamily N-acetyltransferase